MGPPVEAFVIDREKNCPLLIRLFCKPGSHHKLEEFAIRGKEPGSDAEIQVGLIMRYLDDQSIIDMGA